MSIELLRTLIMLSKCRDEIKKPDSNWQCTLGEIDNLAEVEVIINECCN
jgi:hypothetical protein